jgi:tetratricopeptide (TPR) repeat protein
MAPGRAWRSAAPYFLVLLGLLLAALALPGYRTLLRISLETRTALENLITQVEGQFHLLTRPLLLLHTNLDPDLPARTRWTAELWPPAAVLLGLMTLAAWQWRRRPWLGLGIAWYFVQLAATNSVLPRLDVANDRQLYLALTGPAWILGVLLSGLTRRRLALALAVGIIAVLALATMLRNRDYTSEVSLWQATAEASPRKPRVWNNLGYAREIAGNKAGAREAYLRALALDPDYVKARINLSRLEAAATEGQASSPLR